MILLEELESVACLQGLAPRHRARLASLATPQEFAAGSVLFREGEACSWVYILLEGGVDLEANLAGQPVVVQTIGPGELLGWSSVLMHGPMTATARTTDRSRLAAFAVRRLETSLEEDPTFGVEFFKLLARTLAERLHATRLQVAAPR